MPYCENKSKATVIYKFANGSEKRFEANGNQLPIEVITDLADDANSVVVPYSIEFNGVVEQTYQFTINAPSSVPRNLPTPPQIWLLNGTWDDWGTIGSYNTGDGVVKTYSGSPVRIGNGYSISGTVVNKLPLRAYFEGSIEFRYGGCKIEVFDKNNQKIFSDKGICPVTFNVVCGDGCPPGHIKCESKKYPGYCCIPCTGTASKINNLATKARCCNG